MSTPDSPITRTQRNARDAAGSRTAQRRKRGAPPRQGKPTGYTGSNRFVAGMVRAAQLAACGVVSMIIIFLILGVIGVIALAFYKL